MSDTQTEAHVQPNPIKSTPVREDVKSAPPAPEVKSAPAPLEEKAAPGHGAHVKRVTPTPGKPATPQDPPLGAAHAGPEGPGPGRQPVTSPPIRPPDRRLARMTVVVGLWQVALAAVTLVATFAAWPWVSLLASQATVEVTWFGPAFDLTPTSGALLLGLIGGVAGSLVHTISIFSSRVGRGTFEASYLWWFLARPFAAGLLAVLFVAAVHSGLVSVSGTAKDPGLVVAFIAGGLAGLSTDAVLQKLRSLLGATSTAKPASKQKVPHAAEPKMITDGAGD